MTVRVLALALVGPLALGACSGGGAESVEPGGAGTTGAPTATSAASPGAVTTPGSVLRLGDTGSFSWEAAPGTTAAVDLAVEQVQRKPARVLAGWVPADEVGGMTPYFVRARVTNTGDDDLAGTALPLYLRDTAGVLAPAVTFGSDYGRCSSTPLPEPFGPGEEAQVCLVYTLAPDAEPDALTFQASSAGPGAAWEVR